MGHGLDELVRTDVCLVGARIVHLAYELAHCAVSAYLVQSPVYTCQTGNDERVGVAGVVAGIEEEIAERANLRQGLKLQYEFI